jgi:hypothetical protein
VGKMNIKFIPNGIGLLFITAFFILVGALLYALPVWLIWNYLMPRLFGLPSLSIIDAFLLNILVGILFRGKEKQ